MRALKCLGNSKPSSSRQVETIARHATPVLGYHVLTGLLRIGGAGEEHTLVAGGFLFFAYAAWLKLLISNCYFGSSKPK